MCRLLEPLHGSLPITSAILTALKKKLDNFPCIQLPTTTPLRFFIFFGNFYLYILSSSILATNPNCLAAWSENFLSESCIFFFLASPDSMNWSEIFEINL